MSEKLTIELHKGMLTLKPEDFIDPVPVPKTDPETGLVLTLHQRAKLRKAKLKSEHMWKLTASYAAIPEADRSGEEALRCFSMTCQKDKNCIKIKDFARYPKFRCRKSAVKGSFHCFFHGGGNKSAEIHGNYGNNTNSNYRGAYTNEVGQMFDAYINDPEICCLKPEIAHMRTILQRFLTEITKADKPMTDEKEAIQALKTIKAIRQDSFLTPLQKFQNIKDYCNKHQTIGSSGVMKDVTKAAEAISKIIKRFHDIQTSDKFMLTPDGLKLILKKMSMVLEKYVSADKLLLLKEDLLTLDMKTQTDLKDEFGNKPQSVRKMLETEIDE